MKGRDRGAALVAVLVIVLLASGIAAAALAATPSIVRESSERVGRTRARYLAMEAAARAHNDLNLGGLGELARRAGSIIGADAILATVLNDLPITLIAALENQPDESSVATSVQLGDGSYRITAYGKAQGLTEGVVVVVRRQTSTPSPWRDLAVGANGIDADGTTYTDSYDSDSAAYLLHALGLGFATGTNGSLISNGSIDLDGGTIRGSVHPGPSGSFTGGGATVSGSTAPLAAPEVLPPVRYTIPATSDNLSGLPGRVDGSGRFMTSGGDTINMPGGTYVLSRLELGGSTTLDVTGDVTLFMTGEFRLEDAARVRVRPGGSLKVYTSADMRLGGRGLVNQTGPVVFDPFTFTFVKEGDPEKLQIFASQSSTPEIDFREGVPFWGGIYAPTARIEFDESNTVYGALVGREIYSEYTLYMHFDQALTRAIPHHDRLLTQAVVARWWATR